MTRLVVRPLAEADLDEAFAWYESRSVNLGVDFLRAVDACFDAIVTHRSRIRLFTAARGEHSSAAFLMRYSTFSERRR